jgi:hypothetical protein
MKKLLLAAALCVLAAPAYAQSCTVESPCDPPSFHMTAAGATAAQGAIFLNESTTVNIDEINNDTINPPLHVIFAVPTTDTAALSISKFGFDDGTFQHVGDVIGGKTDTLSLINTWTPSMTGAGKDLYTENAALCGACNGDSIDTANVEGAENNIFGTTGVKYSFKVYVLTINGNTFDSKTSFETIDGLFPLGTIIAPFDASGTKVYDTSWTNTAVVNQLSSAPEPSTWAMMLIGFAGLSFAGYRKAHSARTALSAA